MKNGSIVECVKTLLNVQLGCTPVYKTIKYTVSEVFASSTGTPCVRLYEITNPINPDTGKQYGYVSNLFREIEFPPSLEAEIEESLNRELVEKW